MLRRSRYFSIGQDKRDQSKEKAERDAAGDIWTKCPKCNELLYTRELQNNLKVCQKCGYHFRLSAQERIEYLTDGSFRPEGQGLTPVDSIGFVASGQSYATKLEETIKKRKASKAPSGTSATALPAKDTAVPEALVYGSATIDDVPAMLVVSDFHFFGGSMGAVYGEKLVRAAEMAVTKKIGLVTVSASGGARMQEGIFSLMQMAKTSAALAALSEARLPHISVLTDPCMGGVTASYASSADVVMAEPGALIGFAGPRVIEQTIKQKLPPDFQTSEFLLKHGMVDMVSPRRELKPIISRLLSLYSDKF